MDWQTGAVAPVPGVWSGDFDRVCGSAAVIRYTPEDVPETLDDDTPAKTYRPARSHKDIRIAHDEYGLPLDPVPFPAAVYVLNTRQNISSNYRGGPRENVMLQRISDLALDQVRGIDEAFGLNLSSDYRAA
jgi:hypothetical protein